MPSKMMQSAHVDENEWPTLDNKHAEEGDDWEHLSPDESSESQNEKPVVVVETDLRSRKLRHSVSTPDLHQSDLLDIVEEEGDHDHSSELPKEDASSFAMLSGPRSVISVSSFRDAILSQPATTDSSTEEKPKESSRTATQQQRLRVKPKFVVKPISRCAKSTGDLQFLAMIHEDEEVLGETDAMEFYHRKAQGAKSRSNGMKLRPDEAKRKEITMHKKDLQRKAGAIRG